MMLRRKKRRIAHGTDSTDVGIDNKFQEERWSIFSGLQRKWSTTSTKFDGGFHSVMKKEATRRVLSKRLPGIRLRTRILLKKVKETCLKFFSSNVTCKRNNESGDSHNVKRAHHVGAMSSVQAGCRWRFRSSTKLHHHQHQQHKHCHQHHHYYHDNHAIFPSLADEDAIADCIEFIKRSSSSSSSLSPSSSSSSSTTSTLHGGVTN